VTGKSFEEAFKVARKPLRHTRRRPEHGGAQRSANTFTRVTDEPGSVAGGTKRLLELAVNSAHSEGLIAMPRGYLTPSLCCGRIN
jgi:hypothetical protein